MSQHRRNLFADARDKGRGFGGTRYSNEDFGVRLPKPDPSFQKSSNSENLRGGRIKVGPSTNQHYNEGKSGKSAEAGQGKNRFQNRFHGNEDRQDQPKVPKQMTYGRLKDWASAEDPEDLALFMSNEMKQIENFLTQDRIKEDWYSLFASSAQRMIGAQLQKTAVSRVLDLLCKTPFLDKHLTAFVLDKMAKSNWHEGENFVDTMIQIFEMVLKILPDQSIKIITAFPQLQNVVEFYGLDKVAPKVTDIKIKANQVYKTGREQPKSRLGLTAIGDTPPDDYRELSVLPTCEDIQEEKNIFVRPIVLEGGYKDKDHYLDVQFRLMKQDFVIPLRKGISDFRKSGKKKHFSSPDLRMYHGVHILGMVTSDGIDHVLQFDNSKLKSVKWDFSKRLIFGSLVCLSKDGFETVAIATISNRNPNDLKHGYVNVNVKSGLNIIFNSTSNDEFVMAETVALYESYCHVLEGLQEMGENLPLEENIVSCEKKVKPPHYLLGGTSSPSYDISPFMKDSSSVNVPVLVTTKWPASNKMCLNESQRTAAQMALTKRLAVIQGPPGTGKTYVGLKVVQTILDNQVHEQVVDTTDTSVSKKSKPILVVCYTNHALDQFLEGILQFCEGGVIRVGGRSKSDCLERYNLKTIKKKMKDAKQLGCISMEKARKECSWRLRSLTDEIQKTAKQMEQIDCGTCSQEKLLSYDVICEDHKESMLQVKKDDFVYKGSALGLWLNAQADDPEKSVAKSIESCLTRLILEGNFPKHDSQLTVTMKIEDRATLYQSICSIFRSQIQAKILQLTPYKDFPQVDEEIEVLYNQLHICETEIIPDHFIRLVWNGKMFDNIKHFLGRKGEKFPNEIFKAWLLGWHQEVHEQLNDIESLQTQSAKLNAAPEHDMELDDVKRVEADDPDKEFDMDYLAKTKALRNSFTSIIQRLDVLGVDNEDGQVKNMNEGWQQVSKPLSYTKLRKKIKNAKPMSEEQEKSVTNIWDLAMKERFALYKLWIERAKSFLSVRMEHLVEQYESVLAEKNEITSQETVSILQKASVIGMTTTGAARYRSVLQAVGCRIIVVEEAAEVLESHIVTALNKHCEHLILIGDHQQLRPSPVVYELAKIYGLDISLFERLVKNGFPHVVLQEQHRMRPEISKIMRHIYPDLKDHPDVSLYEHVQGVAKDIFLIQHKESESSVEDSRSRSNVFEASYATKLCSYLLLQGYEPSQITILATYAGQVLAIKGKMKTYNCDSRVKVTSVDNFQGEENDIIILSLVRSNEDDNIGFLKVDNRVCVALSRAKVGLFILGNFELLSSKSKLWNQILLTAHSEGIVGDGLPVVCSNHPDNEEVLMFHAEDFDKRPLGGCGLPCHYRLSCGHLCELTCHAYDKLHKDYRCTKPCTKTCARDHRCQKKCFQDCGECQVKVKKVIPSCGHEDLIPCYLQPEEAVCSQPCEEILDDCEHQCSGKCGLCRKYAKHALCEKKVHYLWPCGHKEEVKCHQKPSQHPCPHPCETILECGHKCKGSCSGCLQGKVHLACREFCEKKLPCGHLCNNHCSAPCSPCEKPCPSKCRHGPCGKSAEDPKGICGHICIPCKEKCKRCCKCQTCTNPCSEICSNQPCSERCKRKLPCGHKCSGICGEICVCGICSKIITLKDYGTGVVKPYTIEATADGRAGKGTAQNVDTESSELDKSSQQDTHPLLLKLPTCDHVFYVEELDQYVNNYEPGGSSFIPCPRCQMPIQKCSRYEHINQVRAKKRRKLKKALMKENELLAPDKEKLLKSKKVLENSSELLKDFQKIDPYGVKNKSHLLAVSLKFKLAFVLNDMDSLKPYVDDESQFSQMLLTRKGAVLQIGKYFTAQQRREFIVDFACCLCRAVLIKIKDICLRPNQDIPASLTDLVQDTGVSVPDEGLRKFLELTETNLNIFLEDNKTFAMSSFAQEIALQCDVIKKRLSSAFQILQSKDSEFLSDFIQTSTTHHAGAKPKAETKGALSKSKTSKTKRSTLSEPSFEKTIPGERFKSRSDSPSSLSMLDVESAFQQGLSTKSLGLSGQGKLRSFAKDPQALPRGQQQQLKVPTETTLKRRDQAHLKEMAMYLKPTSVKKNYL